MKFKARSRLGQWAVRFALIFLVLLVLLALFAELLNIVPGGVVTVLGAAAVLCGIVAILTYKDRSPLVVLATGSGLTVFAHIVMKLPFGA